MNFDREDVLHRDPALNPTIDPAALPDEIWRAILNPQEYLILRKSSTEPAGSGRYLHHHLDGTYHCAGCSQLLFDAHHKFDSGSGWPSFYQVASPRAVSTHLDTSREMERVEVRCRNCNGHLGHLFEDAPDQPTGLRYCINGFALIFVPRGQSPLKIFQKHRAHFY